MASKRGKGAVAKAQADEAAAKAQADADEEPRKQERELVAALKAPLIEPYLKNLMRQFAETGNPMYAVEALVQAPDHPIVAPARKWLRVGLAGILGLAYGNTRARKKSVAQAMGISKAHIKSRHIDYRRRLVRSLTEKFRADGITRGRGENETLDEAVSIIRYGSKGENPTGPIYDGLAWSSIKALAKKKRL